MTTDNSGCLLDFQVWVDCRFSDFLRLVLSPLVTRTGKEVCYYSLLGSSFDTGVGLDRSGSVLLNLVHLISCESKVERDDFHPGHSSTQRGKSNVITPVHHPPSLRYEFRRGEDEGLSVISGRRSRSHLVV